MAFKYLTTEDLFDINRKAVSGILGEKSMADLFGDASREQEMGEEAMRAVSEEDEPSLFDRAKGFAGGALDVIGRPGQAILELGRGTSLLKGKIGGGSNALKALAGRTEDIEGGPANLRAAMSIDPNAGGRLAGAADLAGSAFIDPLSYVTLGAGAAAKGALTGVARAAGDDVAQAIRQGGVRAGDEALAARAGQVVPAPANDLLAQAVGRPTGTAFMAPAGGPRSVRELLESQADTGLARGNLDDIVDKQVRNLERRGRGGLGFAGFQSGIGAGFGQGVATSPAVQSLHRLLSPTAAVGQELGQVGREAVDVAIHTGANVRRVAHKELADQFSDMDELNVAIQERVTKAMVDDLDSLGGPGRLVAPEAKEGWVKLAEDAYVPKVVKEALDQAKRTPSSDLMKGIDSATALLKRYTTLGPLNMVPHVARNIWSNKLFAALYGNVRDPRLYNESFRLRQALVRAKTADGTVTPEAVALQLGEEPGSVAVRRALALHDHQLPGRGSRAFDDVGEELAKEQPIRGAGQQVKAVFDTRRAAQLNSFDEEVTRGAVFLKALDDGLDPRLASKRARHAMLDYTDEGLTKFEREKLQRVLFFYKFPRRAVPAGLEFMVRYPGATIGLSEAGLGVAQGARNEYNEVIGGYVDSPLEATVDNIAGFFMDPTDPVNPVLREAIKGMSGGGFSFTEALPPLDAAGRMLERNTAGEGEGILDREGGIAPNAPGPYGVGALFGLREGKDFAAERWREDMQERVLEKGEPSDLDRLILWAEREGIPDPYKKSKGALAKALKAKGYTAQDIGALLKGE